MNKLDDIKNSDIINENHYSDLVELSRYKVAEKLGWGEWYKKQKQGEIIGEKEKLRYKFISLVLVEVIMVIGLIILGVILFKVIG